jgi:protease-4
MSDPEKRQTPVGWIVLVVVGVLGLVGSCAACGRMMNAGQEETFGDGARHVGVLELSGPIGDASELVRDIRRFGEREDLDAIVLRVESPGGAVAPSQEIFAALRSVAVKKVVVVSIGTVAASGGFWVAMAGDRIFASPGSITGSIGVISQMAGLSRLVGALGVDFRTYRTGEHKDFGNAFREPTAADERLMMDLMTDLYEQFVAVVAERRQLPIEAVRPYADGRVFSGQRAKALGFIDELGGLHEAAFRAAELAEARDADKEGREPEPIGEPPTLVFPKKPGPGLLALLAEGAGRALVRGMGSGLGEGAREAARELHRGAEVEAR